MISKKGNHWYAAIQVEYTLAKPIHPAKTAVGIDMGIVKFAALSTGDYIEPINSFRND